MRLALATGAIVGLLAPAVGFFLVERKASLIGDGLGHVAFAGVALGYLLGISPVLTALVAAVIGALTIEWLRTRGGAAGDQALALVFYTGIAAGVVLVSKAGALNVNLFQFLFGSILTVTRDDLWTVLVLGIGALVTIAVLFRGLVATVLDEEGSRVAGVPVTRLNVVVAVLAALTVAVSMRIVGILLIAALMVLPVIAANRVAWSLRSTFALAMAFGIGSVISGLSIAYYADLPPGGTIVLVAAGAFRALRRRQRSRAARQLNSSSTLPSFPGSCRRSKAAPASAAGKTASTSGVIRPEARCGTTAAREGLHRGCLLLQRPGAQRGSDQPRALEHDPAQRQVRLVATAGADDHDAALARERIEVALEVRGADQLENDGGAAELAGPVDELVERDRLGAEPGDPAAQAGRADGREHAGARDRTDLHRGRADAAVGAVDDEHVAEREITLRADRIVRGDECLGHGRRLALAEARGDRSDVALVDEDTVGEPAAADDAEHPVAGLEASAPSARRRSTDPATSSPGTSGGEPGGAG